MLYETGRRGESMTREFLTCTELIQHATIPRSSGKTAGKRPRKRRHFPDRTLCTRSCAVMVVILGTLTDARNVDVNFGR